MSAAGKRFRVSVPLDAPAAPRDLRGDSPRNFPAPLTLATAHIVRVTGLSGEPEETIIPGATVARLLEAADDRVFDYELIACELRGSRAARGGVRGRERAVGLLH